MHRGRSTRRYLAALACLAVPFVPLRAQTMTVIQGLSFGTVFSGSTKSIPFTDTQHSAQWSVPAILGLLSNVSFTLPTNLVGPGGKTLPITFCSTCAGYYLSNSPASAIVFDPKVGKSFTIALLSTVYIWLGASISPPLNQPAGSYTASVTATYASLL